jgi:anaerobic magnesium-protoporphyrin IX monomethyl ester cyclase
MRVLLLNPLVREWARPNCVPLGLCYIAASLERAGHQVEIFDLNALRPGPEEIARKLAADDYAWAGIGGIVTTYRYVKWLIGALKAAHPDRPVVVGGSVATSIPETLLSRTAADVAAIGEGERTVVELAAALATGRDLSGVRGIWWRTPAGEIRRNAPQSVIANLDELPRPARELVPMEEVYLKNPVGAPNRNKWSDGAAAEAVRTTNLMATRGCPYKCIYCYHDFLGYKYRHRSPADVVAEMKELRARYRVDYFHFTDDEFMIRKAFVAGFCAELRKWGEPVTWGCGGRVNLADEKLFREMKDSGCVVVCYGIESGSQRMLDLMKKQVTTEQAERALKLTQKVFGWNDVSLMVGLPGETRESLRETVEFCKRAEVAPEVIFFATPYPGTELYGMARERERIPDEEAYVLGLAEQGERIACNLSDIPDEELRRLRDGMVQELGAWNRIRHAADGAAGVPGAKGDKGGK